MKSLVKIDEDMIKQLNSKMFKIALLTTILGSSLILTSILLSVGFELIKFNTLIVAMLTIPTGLGALMLFSYSKAKSIARKNVREIEVEFFKDLFESRVINNGEVIATQKVKYSEIVKVKETKEYLFVYSSAHTFVPVDKKAFTSEQLAEIRLMISKSK